MSISRARTDRTDPVPGREGTRVSVQPTKRPPPRASSRGALGSQGLPRGSAWSRGVKLLQGQQGQSAGFRTFPDFQPDRSPSEEGLRSLLSIWGVAAARDGGPQG